MARGGRCGQNEWNQCFLADTNIDYLTSEWPGTQNFKSDDNFDMFSEKYGQNLPNELLKLFPFWFDHCVIIPLSNHWIPMSISTFDHNNKKKHFWIFPGGSFSLKVSKGKYGFDIRIKT